MEKDTNTTDGLAVDSVSAGSRLSSYHIGKATDLSELEQLESEVQNSDGVLNGLVSNGTTKFISCENTE